MNPFQSLRQLSYRTREWAVRRTKKLAQRVYRAWYRLLQRPIPPPPVVTIHTDDVPEFPEVRVVYIVGDGSHQWYAVFVCPCGCEETIHLSLLEDERPRWRITQHEDGTITVSPSIWRNRGCRSHFFVRRGQFVWCKNS